MCGSMFADSFSHIIRHFLERQTVPTGQRPAGDSAFHYYQARNTVSLRFLVRGVRNGRDYGR